MWMYLIIPQPTSQINVCYDDHDERKADEVGGDDNDGNSDNKINYENKDDKKQRRRCRQWF